MKFVLCAWLLLGGAACTSLDSYTSAGRDSGTRPTATEAEALLDDWHRAASEADMERYLGAMDDDAVFLGTDASERWTKAEFAEYVERFFVGEGRGWTYVPRDRRLSVAADGSFAWFEERLENQKYGELRGSGALRAHADGWRIVQYNMTFTIPNGVGAEVVEAVRAYLGTGAPE